MFFKIEGEKKPTEENNENLKSLYIRNGFIETDEKGTPLTETKEE